MRKLQVPLGVLPEERQDQASSTQEDKHAMGQRPSTTFDGIFEGFELLSNKEHGQASGMLKEDFWSIVPISVFKRKGGGGKSRQDTIVGDEKNGQSRGSSYATKFIE